MTAPAPAGPQTVKTALWTMPFVLLCITVLLGYAHQSLLTPAIPLFVADQGGSALFAGAVLLAFSIPSFSVRPFFGHLSDSWSAVGVLAMGLVLLALGGLLYLTPFLALLFVASIVRGLGWAGLNTGGYTLLAAAAPLTRRGEAAGYYTAITTSASILFPALALALIDMDGAGFTAVFVLSILLALVGLPLAQLVGTTTRRAKEKADATKPAPSPGGRLVDTGVLVATGLNLASTLAAPAVGAFLPLYARELEIENIGLFYIIAGITSFGIRPFLGRRSDKMGRGPSLAVGFASQLLGLALIVAANDLPLILAGGIFTSIGSALNGSATTALAMDLADPAHQGKAMATFSISFQLGAGIGSIFAGGLADLVGFRGMYAGCMGVVGTGLLVLALCWRKLPKPER